MLVWAQKMWEKYWDRRRNSNRVFFFVLVTVKKWITVLLFRRKIRLVHVWQLLKKYTQQQQYTQYNLHHNLIDHHYLSFFWIKISLPLQFNVHWSLKIIDKRWAYFVVNQPICWCWKSIDIVIDTNARAGATITKDCVRNGSSTGWDWVSAGDHPFGHIWSWKNTLFNAVVASIVCRCGWWARNGSI